MSEAPEGLVYFSLFWRACNNLSEMPVDFLEYIFDCCELEFLKTSAEAMEDSCYKIQLLLQLETMY